MAKAKKELDRFDKNAKRDTRILTKLMGIIAGAVLAGAFIVLAISIIVFSLRQTRAEAALLEHSASGAESILADWNATLVFNVALLSASADIQEAVAERDGRRLQGVLTAIKSQLDVEGLTIVDSNNVILAGTDDGAGSGTLLSSIVREALRGSPDDGYEPYNRLEFAMVAAAPVRYNGRVVGAVAAVYDLANGLFVDQITNAFDTECTVFYDTLRVDTSLLDANGRKLTGTRLENADITSTVLRSGQSFTGTNVINGQQYMSIYHPLKDKNGTVAGMVFIAKSTANVNQIRNRTMQIAIPAALLVSLILTAISYSFVRWLMWRIYNVTNFLKEMETGDADLTKRCKLFIRDEIGDLIIHFDFFLDKLQDIIRQIKNSKNDLSTSGQDMTASAEDTTSAITQIIANIDGIHSQINSQSKDVRDTASAVNEIASNIESLENMIENQSASVSQASAAVEQMMGNITSVNNSVEKMSTSFNELEANAQVGFTQQEDVNERIRQIESQSEMLEEANMAISSIAEQTNLLAMNAAIEAAHAGEAGKGFSVVADEIRKLSETSSAQSKSIGEQLNKIKDSISEVVSASTASSTAFSAMSNKLRETDELVLQIKAAMQEQNSGSKQISDALHGMNDSTVEVRNASAEMTRGNRAILENVRRLQDTSTSMDASMDEMANGARKINETGAALSDISHTVREAIEKIGAQIDQFKV